MYQKFTLSHAVKALSFALLLLPSLVSGQIILTRWDFNSNPADASTSTGSTTPSTGSGTLTSIGGVAATFASGTGSSDIAATDNTAYALATFPAASSSNKTAGIEFSASTLGKIGISITFDQRSTNTAANIVTLQYSTNGLTFTDATTFTTSSASGSTFLNARTFDLSSITALNNNANVKFRLVSTFSGSSYAAVSGTYATSGTWRFDYVTVSFSSTCASAVASTNWTTPSTWACGVIPVATDNVTIPANITVTLDAAPATINNITFTGANSRLLLGANDLTVNGTITGTAATGYIVTDGMGGLKQSMAATTAKQFPIGTSVSSYDPVSITPTTAAACTFKARVAASINPLYILSSKQTGKVTPRQWDIDLLGGTPTVTLDLTSSDISNAPLNGPAMMGHWNGTSWDDLPAGYSNGTWTASGVSVFSPFIVSQAATPLSVTLESLTLKAKSNMNVLNWSTASEKDNAYFDVQHATNGIDFQSLTQVKGNGTTTAVSNYAYEHADPSVGMHYYRLRQVDANGAATFSKVVSVLSGKKTALSVYPTLATNELHLVTNLDKETDFTIVNVFGQIVLSGRVNQSTDINIGTLTSGHYIVRMANDSAIR
jgi:hypothetical protein